MCRRGRQLASSPLVGAAWAAHHDVIKDEARPAEDTQADTGAKNL
jgi:hypothetical protein